MSNKRKLKELIEYMKPRPLMYLGNSSFSGMVAYINGFAAACDQDILGGFRRWLLKTRFNCEESNFSWCGLVLMLSFPHKKKGYIDDASLSEEENLHAMQTAFSLLLEFLEIDYQNDDLFAKSSSYSAQNILDILRSIREIHLENDGLDIYFIDDTNPNNISSFIPNSFTRELLELIEKHLDK